MRATRINLNAGDPIAVNENEIAVLTFERARLRLFAAGHGQVARSLTTRCDETTLWSGR